MREFEMLLKTGIFKKKNVFLEEGRLVVHTTTWGFQDLRSGRFALNDRPRFL